ncbi:MAG: hypothetical protein J3Q66DRAFT_14819 [Benniella sp.]|nr:MAG: hypothetical protein J3Q66DRAFT_14819 [Benniella sp.]
MSAPTKFSSGSTQNREVNDEQATVCGIETFAEHWTEAQAFSVATLASCAITALEATHVDTLPWKHTFLRSLFRQLGIHSREEQEMFLLLQENGSYQDCNLRVLAEPLLPVIYHQHASSVVTTLPPPSTKSQTSLQQQMQYGEHSPTPSSPTQGSLNQDPEQEEDIRIEVINDLLYIGLGFEPSSRSRKKVPIQELTHDLAGLDLDLPPGYTEYDEFYPIGTTNASGGVQQSAGNVLLNKNTGMEPPQLPPRTEQSYEELRFGNPPPLPPRTPSSTSLASTSSASKPKGRVQPLEYDARARGMIMTMCNYLLLSQESFVLIEKRMAQHLYFYQQELIEAERAELEREQQLKEQQRLQQQQEQQLQGTGPGAKVGAFFSGLRSNRQESSSNVPMSQHGIAMQTQAQSSMQELEKKKKTWKYLATGLSIAAGATVIGLTGGLAAPLVAVGAGVLLGSGAAVLGTTTGIAVMASLFGLAGGGLAGYKMHRRTKDLKVLSFTPILKDPTLPQIPTLHVRHSMHSIQLKSDVECLLP